MNRRALQQAATALATSALLTALAVPTHAATYTQHICQMPNGAPAPADGFLGYTNGTGTSTSDACSSGGPLTATVPSSSPGPTFAGQTYHAPADTTIAAVRVTRSTIGVSQPGNIKYAFIGTSDVCNADASCPSGIAGGEYETVQPPEWADFQIYCPDNPGCQGASGPASIRLHAVVVTLDDSADPQLTPPTGGLFSTGRTLSAQEPVVVNATDDGGGVFTAAVLIDGVEKDRWVVDDNGGACLQPFVKRVPCKLSVSASHPFDTTQLANGAHQVSLVVYDATEVNSASYGPVDVVVDNTAPPPSGGGGGGGGAAPPPEEASTSGTQSSAPSGIAPVVQSAALSPSVAARILPAEELGDGLVTAEFGKPVRISGVLVDELRRPIANAKLNVFATPDEPGAKRVIIGTATTTANGAFSFTADPGPSRTITVDYRPAGAAAPVATLGAHVIVRAAVRLRASRSSLRNGRMLRLTAKVLGDKRYRGRAKVAFQVLIGKTWRTFATGAANRRGIARAGHRFTQTFTTVRYRFRALTLAARGFPYAAGRSRPVAVVVRP